jgi:hypothetical protein
MEDFGKRTILLLAAAFVIANLGWAIYLREANRSPVIHCSYHGPSLICASSGER